MKIIYFITVLLILLINSIAYCDIIEKIIQLNMNKFLLIGI